MKPSQLRARYRRIVFFFARVTASFIYWEILLPKLGLGGWTNRTRSERNKRIAVRFRALAIRMGGLMIKVGQFLSARLDVLPAEITQELAGLQDEVPAEGFEAIRAQAEADLGRPVSEAYAWLDEEPLAAASLGQVHRARLRDAEAEASGGFRDVVVKVQRPYIDQIVDVDLAALRRVGGWLQRYKPVRDRANVPALVEEFATTTLQEIDYIAEGHSAETFAAAFADDPHVHVPRVVWDVTTGRVLTLEDVSAIKLGDYDAIEAAGISRAEVAVKLVDTYMKQILEDGFFHADPHPGNLFVTPLPSSADDGDKPRWQLTFVDFGMVGHVPDNLRDGLREMLIAIGTQDAQRLVASFNTLGVLLPSADMRLIESASTQLFQRFFGMSMADLRNVDQGEMMRFALQFQELLLEMPFQLPENLLLLGRTVAILSGMATGLDPDFNLWTSLAPYANKLVSAEGGSTLKTFLAEATKVLQTLVGLPGRTDRVLGMIERGELNVRTPLLELRVARVARSVDRMTGGLIFAALLIAGAVLRPADPSLARLLMGASALPLVWVLLFAGGHPRR